MADHFPQRVDQGQSDSESDDGIGRSFGIAGNFGIGSGFVQQRMLQLDGATGEVQGSSRGLGKRRGRLKNLSVFVRLRKNTFSQPGAAAVRGLGVGRRGLGVKRKRGRPRKIPEAPSRILSEDGGTSFDEMQVNMIMNSRNISHLLLIFPEYCSVNTYLNEYLRPAEGQILS